MPAAAPDVRHSGGSGGAAGLGSPRHSGGVYVPTAAPDVRHSGGSGGAAGIGSPRHSVGSAGARAAADVRHSGGSSGGAGADHGSDMRHSGGSGEHPGGSGGGLRRSGGSAPALVAAAAAAAAAEGRHSSGGGAADMGSDDVRHAGGGGGGGARALAPRGSLSSIQDITAIRHVMLVDDEVTLRRLGARMLQAQMVECDALEDGCEVAAALKPSHELLLLDIVMRQSDGVEVHVPRAARRCWRVLALAAEYAVWFSHCAVYGRSFDNSDFCKKK